MHETESTMELPDRIAETFVGKTVLVTGGTGFLGKVLIEKLLRVCPKIGRIILIVRPKKGKSPQDRAEEILKGPLFEPLLATRTMSSLLDLIAAVPGDIAQADLGLTEEDRVVCQAANIIVHSAATVRFDEGIKTAVLLNTRGTKCMLELAKQCTNLELFLHVSTAYCHMNQKILEEELYPPPRNPHEVIECVEKFTDEMSDIFTPKLLGDYPNTYAYSKALGEALVEEAMESLPAVIVRPSIVVPIFKGPVAGWTDNINGPLGLLIGAGKGVIRTMYGQDQYFADFVPADCVINVMLVIAWDYIHNGYRHTVLNLTSSEEIKVTWREILEIGRDIVENSIPFDTVLWYPGGSMTSHKWLHEIRVILFHWIPAIIVDTLLFLLGYKPLLIRIQKRISKSFEIFTFYTNNIWHFKSDKLRALRTKLNENEKDIYKMDDEGLVLKDYFEQSIMCARRYLMKEKDEHLPRARRHMKIMWYVNVIAKLAIGYLFFSLLFR